MVNNSDLTSYYTQTRLAHEKARALLSEPAQAYYASEEFGRGSAGTGVRVGSLLDLTPMTLEGIHTVTTRQLVHMIRSDPAPVVIDIMGNQSTIPRALVLAQGWMAFPDTQREGQFQDRFAGLLKLLAPDPSRPVVFVGKSRGGWHAANAAFRALKLGYSDVSWYRGGMESWRAAGLPVAPPLVQAVAY